MVELSVIIPARNEVFLSKTVEDLLANIRGNTEIIAVLDGNWPNPPVKDNPRVTLIYHSQSIGQRAAMNEAAKLSRAKYLMKLDAHCAVDEGFDVKLLADMQDDWTMVPIMRNLHVFDWVCEDGHRRYQGPSGPCKEKECGKPTKMDVVWIAKTNPQSKSYAFNSEPHFIYFNDFKSRPEYEKSFKETGLTETMSLQGSAWMVTREKYWELNLGDETFGSWGSQGIQIAVSTWLSGGRVICNHKTWYGHCFRTQGGDFGFPYPISGRQVDRAKKYAKDLFFNNKWPKQILPLSWLLDRFWPVPGWSAEARAKITEAGITFTTFRPTLSVIDSSLDKVSMIVNPLTDFASSHDSSGSLNASGRRQEMPSDAMSLSTIDSGTDIRSKDIIGITNQGNMEGITTGGIITNDMIKNGDMFTTTIGNGNNQPSIHESVNQKEVSSKTKVSIPEPAPVSIPDPTLSQRIQVVDINLGKNSKEVFTGDVINGKIFGSHKSSSGEDLGLESGGCLNHSPTSPIISPPIVPVNPSSPSHGIIYYSDCQLAPEILEPCQKSLLRCSNGHRIVSVTLKPMDFGENYTLPFERSVLTMFKQILEAIKRSTSDILFFCEHDCLYTKEHFQFTPPRKDVFYYNENQWQVDATTGRALFYHCMRLSAMCAYRELLLEHYTKRVERVEKEGFTLRMGYEPGGHRYPRGVDNYTRDRFMTPYPLIDLRHTGTVSPNRWRQRDFRNQGPLWAWTESGTVPFWGETKGRMKEFLEALK